MLKSINRINIWIFGTCLMMLFSSCFNEELPLSDPLKLESVKLHGSGFEDEASDIVPYKGGYLLYGRTTSGNVGAYEIYLVATDAQGNERQTRVLHLFEEEEGAVITTGEVVLSEDEEDIFICGDVLLSNGFRYAFLAKIQSDFELDWVYRYGEDGFEHSASSMALVDNAIIYMLGKTTATDGIKAQEIPGVVDTSDYYLLRVDVDFPDFPVFAKSMGYAGADEGKALMALDDGTLLALGTSDISRNGFIDKDIILMKISYDGNVIHTNNYGWENYNDFAANMTFNEFGDTGEEVAIVGHHFFKNNIEEPSFPVFIVANPYDLEEQLFENAETYGIIRTSENGEESVVKGRFTDVSTNDDNRYVFTGAIQEAETDFNDIIFGIWSTENPLVQGENWEDYGADGDDAGVGLIGEGDGAAVLGNLEYARSSTMVYIKL